MAPPPPVSAWNLVESLAFRQARQYLVWLVDNVEGGLADLVLAGAGWTDNAPIEPAGTVAAGDWVEVVFRPVGMLPWKRSGPRFAYVRLVGT